MSKMLAMAVVSHQCVAGLSDERGNNSMKEDDDLLSRLRYLRQTLQDCHMRVSVLDERVEALHPVLHDNPKEVNTPTLQLADENAVSAKKTQFSYNFINGNHVDENVMITQEPEDDSLLHDSENKDYNLCHYEPESPKSKLHSCLTDNHLKHLAQKHASELCNMYWSYSVDKKSDKDRSNGKRQFKKAVTWGNDEYKIFSRVNEDSVQNGTEYSDSSFISDEYNHAGKNVYPANPELVEFFAYDGLNDTITESAIEVNDDPIDKYTYTRILQPSAKHCRMTMDRDLTSKNGNDELITENNMDDSQIKFIDNSQSNSSDSKDDENTEVPGKGTVSENILNSIMNPWFRKALIAEDDSEDILHSKRRKHTLIRSKRIDFDDQDVEYPSKTDTHMSEESIYHVEEPEPLREYTNVGELDEIIIEDVSFLEVIPEESERENGSEHCPNTDVSITKEDGSVNEVIHSKGVSKPEPDINEKLNVIGEHLDFIRRSIFALCSDSKHPTMVENLHQQTKVSSKGNENDDDGSPTTSLPACLTSSTPISDRQNKVELNDNKDAFAYQRRLSQLTDDSLHNSDTIKSEKDKSVKSKSTLMIRRRSNEDPVLNQHFSGDLKSLVVIVIMFLLLFAVLFIFYLLITVPVLVVSLRHNGSSVAF